MKIAIIGAGFTGLSAAYQLQKLGHSITIFEKDSQPGGLAIGYQEKEWEWSLEKHYHHWFTNDDFVRNLASEIGQDVLIKRPKTSVFVENQIYQLDSPLKFLTFPRLPFIDRLRMTASLGALRVNPYWKPLEKVRAVPILSKLMGKKAWELLWEPQLRNKMGKYADEISLVWFWTRINKRTSSLAYPAGGFLHFAKQLVKTIEKKGGTFYFSTEILSLSDDQVTSVSYKQAQTGNQKETFDRIIVTVPSYLFLKIAPQLPDSYKKKLVKLQGLGATNMVIRMKKQFLTDGTYWLSICEKDSPILVVVEHTNLMDKKHYNNEHLVYVGNYLDTQDPRFTMDKEKLLEVYDPLLKRLHPDYQKNIIAYEVFRAPFAQPIVPINYSTMIPPMETPLPHVFLANIEQVYPWDRGTNYAVELGETVAKLVSEH